MTAAKSKVVKSARRALEVLEFFGPGRGTASASEIARCLNYPISSTAELLWNLAEMGYLEVDPATREFFPTAKLPLLGWWVLPDLFGGRLLSAIDELAMETGQRILLGMREGIALRYLHAVRGPSLIRDEPPRSSGRCMLHSAMGRLFLSQLPQHDLPKVVTRLNSEVEPEWRVRWSGMVSDAEQIKEQGYSMIAGLPVGNSALAIPLGVGRGHDLALAVTASSEVMESGSRDMLNMMLTKRAKLGSLEGGWF